MTEMPMHFVTFNSFQNNSNTSTQKQNSLVSLKVYNMHRGDKGCFCHPIPRANLK